MPKYLQISGIVSLIIGLFAWTYLFYHFYTLNDYIAVIILLISSIFMPAYPISLICVGDLIKKQKK
ncbi:MAG TPA: hypothetical protein DD377_03395 [Firmicutes bacterium]|nr:hypothetical protein [Bacillota bacterium]